MEKKVRPKTLPGLTRRMVSGCGNCYITVNVDKDGPFEVFAHLGKAGGCASCQLEAVTRSVSAGLRRGVEPEVYIQQLKGIKCPAVSTMAVSCPEAIAIVLEEVVNGIRNSHKSEEVGPESDTPD